MKKNVKLLIFDLDGTLIDSQEDIISAVNKTLSFFGREKSTSKEIRDSIGSGIFNFVAKRLLEKEECDLSLAHEFYKKSYQESMLEKTSVYQGVIEVLEELGSFPKVILTNKSNDYVLPILKEFALDKYFVKYYGKESFIKNKPDPFPILKIAEEFNILPEEIIIIGDSEIDILAGKKANARTIGVSYGYGDVNKIKQEGSDYIVHHPREILDLFN